MDVYVRLEPELSQSSVHLVTRDNKQCSGSQSVSSLTSSQLSIDCCSAAFSLRCSLCSLMLYTAVPPLAGRPRTEHSSNKNKPTRPAETPRQSRLMAFTGQEAPGREGGGYGCVRMTTALHCGQDLPSIKAKNVLLSIHSSLYTLDCWIID